MIEGEVKKYTRRQVLRAGTLIGGTFIVGGLVACAEPQDIDPTPAPKPTPTELQIREARNRWVLNLLKPGNKVPVWDGVYRIGPDVRRRPDPAISPAQYRENALGDTYIYVPGVDYRYTFREEVITSPLRLYGDRWMTYFSPNHGMIVNVAVVENDTDKLIRRNDVRLSNLRASTWEKLSQEVQIEKLVLDERDPLKPSLVLARRTNGQVEQILQSYASRVLWIF